MSGRTIAVTLPEAVYERARETAEVSSLSVQQVLAQSIALSFPELEDDLPPEIRSELATLSLRSDTELRSIANSRMDQDKQIRLEDLAELLEHRALTEAEQSELARLMDEAERVMIRKAEAYRLLARRGHAVFDTIDSSLVSPRARALA